MNVLLLRQWLAENAGALIGSRLREVRQVDGKSFALHLVGVAPARPGRAALSGGSKPQAAGAPLSSQHAAGTEAGATEQPSRAGAATTLGSLLFSILEAYPVLALLDDGEADEPPNPDSNFVKSIRHHLPGAELTAIQQDGFDRSVSFAFVRRDQYGRETARTLRIELVGRASNAYLLNERGLVISIMKPVPPGRNRVRRVLTGKPLPPPPPLGKYIAAESDVQSLASELAALRESVGEADAVRELLTRRIAGGEVCLWPKMEPQIPVSDDALALQALIQRLQSGELDRELFGSGSANAIALAGWRAAKAGEGSPSRAAQATLSVESARAQQIAAQLALARRADELETLGLEMLQRAQSIAERESEAKYLREWIAANPDWAGEVDLAKGAHDNAGAVIQYAQRLRRALPKLEELTSRAALSGGLEFQRTGAPISSQHATGTEAGATDAFKRDASRLVKANIKYLRFTSSDGVPILCGQTDRSNDELVRLYGSSRHLWLHARDYPGSHVLLLSNGADVPARTLHEAAVVAGYFSQGRGERELAVSYTPLKQLRRPRGGKPGQVLKLSEKVVFVDPMDFESLRDTLRLTT